MAAVTIKNLPDELYERLKMAAQTHHRSINGEAIFCIERVLNEALLSADDRLTQIRKLRKTTEKSSITEEEINELKTWGRE
jgi:plasmid stability protein